MANLGVDFTQAVKTGLSALNVGANLSLIADATVSGANTYATFRARVAANIAAAGVANEFVQAGNVDILKGLDMANAEGTLTNTRLNGLTTVAAVRALFTADDPTLASTYTGCLPE